MADLHVIDDEEAVGPALTPRLPPRPVMLLARAATPTGDAPAFEVCLSPRDLLGWTTLTVDRTVLYHVVSTGILEPAETVLPMLASAGLHAGGAYEIVSPPSWWRDSQSPAIRTARHRIEQERVAFAAADSRLIA